MSAVIESCGSKFRVNIGQVVRLEKIELGSGETIDFKVLAVGEGSDIELGRPYVDGAKVVGEIINHERGDKITTIKLKRRKHHIKTMGHRQWYTYVRITSINAA